MHKALHLRDDVDRLYVSRKRGGRGLTSIEDRVNASIQRHENNAKKCGGRLITATRNNTDNTRASWPEITRRQKLEEKQLYGQKQLYGYFNRQTSEIVYEKTWKEISKGNLKRETESLLIPLQNDVIRTMRAILNKSWRQHPTKHQLYGHLPPITKTIQVRRTRHAGHCWRSRDELISDVLLWTPTHGRSKAGRPARTYIQQLCEDTGCSPED